MKQYGIPYRGSKSVIADRLIQSLPAGRRFVDLFGGGFAMSHAALLSGKYKEVYYNDIDPLLPPLIQGAIHGKYDYKRFRPEFVTRDKFFAKKETDGYVKFIWSFGNDGVTYMFGRNTEPWKHLAHDFVVFGRQDDEMEKILPGVTEAVTAGFDNIRERRLEFCRYVKHVKNDRHAGELERLERLQQLERLERLQRLPLSDRLTLHTGDYREYEYRPGDVVYCDIPYQTGQKHTGDYCDGFDWGAFYVWAFTRPFPVYISSYPLMRTQAVFERTSALNRGGDRNKKCEILYQAGRGCETALRKEYGIADGTEALALMPAT